MTTDNRTNEQIVAEAICGRRYRSGTPGYLASTDNPTDYGDARSVLTALEAAGRLAGEPTEAQVEAAARAGWPNTDFDDPELQELCDMYRKRTAWILVAAASLRLTAEQEGEER